MSTTPQDVHLDLHDGHGESDRAEIAWNGDVISIYQDGHAIHLNRAQFDQLAASVAQVPLIPPPDHLDDLHDE